MWVTIKILNSTLQELYILFPLCRLDEESILAESWRSCRSSRIRNIDVGCSFSTSTLKCPGTNSENSSKIDFKDGQLQFRICSDHTDCFEFFERWIFFLNEFILWGKVKTRTSRSDTGEGRTSEAKIRKVAKHPMASFTSQVNIQRLKYNVCFKYSPW